MLALLLAVLSPAADPLPSHAKLRIGTTRFRHGGLVRALSFAPDGKSLASASHDGSVSVWDVPAGTERLRLKGHDADVLCVAFSPDGKTLASGGADGTARLWDATTGKPIHSLATKSESIDAVAFSPDGKRLVVGGDDGDLIVLDVVARVEVSRKRHDRAVCCLAWSPDGKRLATSGDAGRAILIYDGATLKYLQSFHDDAVQCLAFGPGERLVSREAGGVFRVWDAESGKQKLTWQGEKDGGGAGSAIYQIAFSPDGKEIVSGSVSGAVEVYDTATGTRKLKLTGRHRDRVAAVAVSSAGVIASGGADHAIHLWSKNEALTPAAEVGGPVFGLALPRKGTELAAIVGPEARVFDRVNGKPAAFVAKASAVAYIDQTLYLSQSEKLLTRDAEKPTVSTREAYSRPITSLSAAGNVLVSVLRDGSTWLHRPGGKPDKRMDDNLRGMRPVLSPDGTLVAAVGGQAPIPLWDTVKGHPRATLAGHRGGTAAAAFSQDGASLVSGGRDKFARVWDVKAARQRGAGLRHDAWVSAVAISADGTRLATGTGSGGVRLYDVKTSKVIRELTGHRGAVTGLAFAADGTLVSSSLDGTILVWDAAGAG